MRVNMPMSSETRKILRKRKAALEARSGERISWDSFLRDTRPAARNEERTMGDIMEMNHDLDRVSSKPHVKGK